MTKIADPNNKGITIEFNNTLVIPLVGEKISNNKKGITPQLDMRNYFLT